MEPRWRDSLRAAQDGPIYRVAANGGPVVPVTELDATRGDTSHRFPRFLPDGVHFLYLVISSRPESGGIYLGSLESKEARRLVDALSKPEFAPPDLLLFLRERHAHGAAARYQQLPDSSARRSGSSRQCWATSNNGARSLLCVGQRRAGVPDRVR